VLHSEIDQFLYSPVVGSSHQLNLLDTHTRDGKEQQKDECTEI